MASHSRYLEGLAASLRIVHGQGDAIASADFASLCEHILGAFDHLGAIMYFAKLEMGGKVDSIKRVSGQLTTLREVVEADISANRATLKGSCARNLHRLMLVITFVRLMLSNLMENPGMQLKDALWNAYQGSLSPIHTYMVRTAVWAGLVTMPTRETFMRSIGETEESARAHVPEVITTAADVVTRLEVLYGTGGIKMPASDTVFIPTAPPDTAAAGQ
ncbi:hypothetical protein VOLCADRAFT_90666 [Volvox carteri f. nagariensis]|uniref:Glycolipid transfer protein domain-containing protein n=1 Tax=Volvox carteri f. nagariensis TaxID=3068 RepID=D8TV06_VOLCA|nr:uncharacterized protein VOLCADRAFT_90666 [Volvox carteri f. nagariensis]EFJ48912.1 hypothetical protein VOLCADRAFT_90666 [Volvox carteri f. nagariensis]|eukprot:XP_002950244.1 hypothetical protein VOLCADRAFT_90666 [Volvox carteri f. nagariensis]